MPVGLEESSGPAAEYLSGRATQDDLGYLEANHPFLLALVLPEYRSGGALEREAALMDRRSWEFEGPEKGGRGQEYNVAQNVGTNRRRGMRTLLNLLADEEDPDRASKTILDVLAGDGTLTRFASTLPVRAPRIVSADISRLMIDSCIAQRLPCIRQSAVKSLLRDESLDGVLIAYGSHHLDSGERREAAGEAFRTLKPGGIFVLHDFEVGGRMDRWFETIVHPYSLTGHAHPHFTRSEMERLMRDRGFGRAEVFAMDDSFEVAGKTEKMAKSNMLRHLHTMYGLARWPLATEAHEPAFEKIVAEVLGEIEIEREDSSYVARVRRDALVAVGVKV